MTNILAILINKQMYIIFNNIDKNSLWSYLHELCCSKHNIHSTEKLYIQLTLQAFDDGICSKVRVIRSDLWTEPKQSHSN